MAKRVDIPTGQRVITEFLPEEGSSPIEIHRCLRSVYGEVFFYYYYILSMLHYSRIFVYKDNARILSGSNSWCTLEVAERIQTIFVRAKQKLRIQTELNPKYFHTNSPNSQITPNF